MAARLLIIDDDPGIISALARGLALHGYAAETEVRADRALARILSESFDGAIVDVMLGADSGIELVRAAREGGVTAPIVMLSALSEVEQRAAGLEAGADDYIVKPFSFDELVARLRVQEHRTRTVRPVPADLDTAARSLRAPSGDVVSLTERECALLILLAENAGQPLSRAEIIDRLWVGGASGTENVVDVYIGYLRRKLAGCDVGFSIKTVRHRGFCLEGLPPRRTAQHP